MRLDVCDEARGEEEEVDRLTRSMSMGCSWRRRDVDVVLVVELLMEGQGAQVLGKQIND